MSRVLTAMSGGVDSAVTAALLLEAGHTVGGATMALHEYAPQELADARRSAERLGIEFHIFDWQEGILPAGAEAVYGDLSGRLDAESVRDLQPDGQIRPVSGQGAGAWL